MVATEARLEQLVERLRREGCRITPQRVAVLTALLASDRHPSAEEVYQELHPRYPMMSRATVYKTIATLKELGEILELEFSDGHNRYDLHTPQPHAHLVCRRCGRIDDYYVPEQDRLLADAAGQSGYQQLVPRFDFYGLCPACASTATPA
jgi:Fur family peroxide stress response transcriptional regulator